MNTKKNLQSSKGKKHGLSKYLRNKIKNTKKPSKGKLTHDLLLIHTLRIYLTSIKMHEFVHVGQK
jgi:hypothetical protein